MQGATIHRYTECRYSIIESATIYPSAFFNIDIDISPLSNQTLEWYHYRDVV